MTEWLIKRVLKKGTDIDDPAARITLGKMAGCVGIACNILLMISKLLAGLLSGSIAIMADAVNNFSDAASSVITLIGFKISGKPADKEHPFGHARFEYIAGLAVAVMVLVIGIELGKSSIEKILQPTPVNFGTVSLLVLALSILVKLWMAVFNRSLGRRIHSPTLEATFADSRNDVIATSAVLVAAIVARLTGLNLDGWMGLAVALFIVISGAGLVKDTLNPLLGTAPSAELVQHVKEKISSYDGILETHDLMVHDYGPGRQFASAHVEISADMPPLAAHEIIDKIERDFLKQDNLHLVLHHDPVCIGNDADGEARSWVTKQVQSIDAGLSIHDLRVIESSHHIHYIFDVVLPPAFSMPEAELLHRMEQALQRGSKPIDITVTVDGSYAPVYK